MAQQIYKCVRFWQSSYQQIDSPVQETYAIESRFQIHHEFIITQLFSANWPNFIFEVLAIYPFSAPKIQKIYVRTTDINSICGNKFWSQ